MANRTESQSWRRLGKLATGVDIDSLSSFELLKIIATHHAREYTSNNGALLFLQSWWSRTYNRPMKDPILHEYTPEELMYEYLDHTERSKHAEETAEQQVEEKEDSKFDEAMKWAEEEEAKDREREQSKEKPEEKQPLPAGVTPEDVKWMEEQLAKEKAELGEDFGEDFSGEF